MNKIENNSDNLIDEDTRAIINIDNDAFLKAKKRREKIIQKDKELLEMKSDIKELKDAIAELTKILKG